MIGVLEGQAILFLIPVEPQTEHQGVHVVRRLTELLVHEFEGFRLVLFFFQDLIGLAEVVVVLRLFLGAEVDVHCCQYDY